MRKGSAADLNEALALIEEMLSSDWDASEAAAALHTKVAEVLAGLGKLKYVVHGDRKIPLIGGPKVLAARAELAARWKRSCDEFIAETAVITLQLARSGDVQLVQWAIAKADEDRARGLLRDALSQHGVSRTTAVDMVKRVPRSSERDDRLEQLTDFAVERLGFAGGKKATSAELYDAFVGWHRRAGVKEERLTEKEFFGQLALSRGVTRHTFGSDGRRQRGWMGVELRPQTGAPGEASKSSKAEFAKFLESQEFVEAIGRARRAAARRRLKARNT